MKLHNLIQGSPEWKAYRAQHFNASDAPAMMGVSPYKTRAELLRELHTGVAADVDVGTQMRFDNGHRAEALARPLAEEFIGAELYPVTGSEGRLSASFDGLTLDERIGFEHKALNNELRRCFAQMETIAPAHRERVEGRELPIYHRVQMEQQLLISGAERVLFMASQWTADEELVEEQHCWYYPDMALRADIVAGWAQFEKDLACYSMPAPAPAAPVGKAPETLPALLIEVTGKVTASNLAEFKATALAAIRSVNRDLNTDQDFADAAKAVKWCSDVESRLEAAKQHALSQTASIDALFKTMDDIGAEARRVRLDLDKLVTRRKTEVKEEAVVAARQALAAHYDALNAELSPARLPVPAVDFAGAIKGLRSFDSMQSALDALVAKSKIEADTAARNIRANIAAFGEQDAGFEFLFPDLRQLVHKSHDDFKATLSARIATHRAAELERQERERQRIRAEEDAKQQAERQRQERLAAERKARIDMRIQQLQDALTAAAGDSSTQIEAKRLAILATEPSEDLYGDRMGEAVTLRSRVLIALGEQHAAAVARETAEFDAAATKAAAPLPALAPAPVAQPTTAPRARAAEQPTLKLGQINERLGYVVNAELLARLGFVAHADRSARLYREGDFKAICAALSAHTLSVAAEVAQAA
jgi:predicted phage-related endonuclease